MQKRIHWSMRVLCLLVLILTAVFTATIYDYAFILHTKSEARKNGALIAQTLSHATDIKAALASIEAEFPDYAITLSEGTQIVFRSKATTAHTTPHFYSYSLPGGKVLSFYPAHYRPLSTLWNFLLPVLFLLVLIYLLSNRLACLFIEHIMHPIRQLNPTGPHRQEIYPELKPMLDLIATQKDEIQYQTERVTRQKLRLQAVSENMSEGLVVLDREATVLSVNQSALSIFSAPETEVIHKSFSNLCADKTLSEHLTFALSGNKDMTDWYSGGRNYRIFFSPVFEQDIVTGVILLMFDTTQQLEAEQMRKEFSANVSHELKTPITTILGYSQIINRGLAKPEDVQEFTKKIEKETARLITLIEDIIKLSHLDEQSPDAQKQPVSLLQTAKEVLERLEPQAEAKGIRTSLSGADSIIAGDPIQIAELVYNLCDNAIKYNKENGLLSVEISPYCICVTDTGIGIPAEDQPRIFERFFRVDKSRSKNVNGTGLGLSIVKHIARCHNAVIDVNSQLGEGTRIRVLFPESESPSP